MSFLGVPAIHYVGKEPCPTLERESPGGGDWKKSRYGERKGRNRGGGSRVQTKVCLKG